jgi:uncharacterized phage-associated protein
MTTPTANTVADYFLTLLDYDEGDSITHLKLQKLVYYGQAWHLALTDKPVFDEPILAWKHGPVVRSLYDRFKDKGTQALQNTDIITRPSDDLSQETREILDEVYEIYGPMTASQLRGLTHDEKPWNDAYDQDADFPNQIISEEAMKEFYKKKLED